MKYTIAEHEKQESHARAFLSNDQIGDEWCINFHFYADLLAEVKRLRGTDEALTISERRREELKARLTDAIETLKALCDRPDYCREWWGYRAKDCLSRIGDKS